MNQLGDHRHRLTMLQQRQCTHLIRLVSAFLLILSAALLLLMFAFAFVHHPDLVQCRAMPASKKHILHRPDYVVLSKMAPFLDPNFLDHLALESVWQPYSGLMTLNGLPMFWPPKLLQSINCVQNNQTDWSCDHLFSSAVDLFVIKLRDLAAWQSSSPVSGPPAVSSPSAHLPSAPDWTLILKSMHKWHASQANQTHLNQWNLTMHMHNDLLAYHLARLRRNNHYYGFQVHCSHSYQTLDNLFDCRPASACDYKLFALLQLTVFQLGVAWFACGSLSLHLDAQPDIRFNHQQNDKHLLQTIKQAQALLLAMNSFSFLVHGFVPLATPILYVAVYVLNMQITVARYLTIIIIVIQYIMFTLCSVLLRSMS